MSTHRFILEPYKGVSTRHTCPNCHHQRCFSKYIDTEKQILFPEYVGRCDHKQKCGYHFTPRDYFDQNPVEKEKFSDSTFRSYAPVKEAQLVVTSYIDLDIVNQSLRGYPANKLFQFLSAQFGETGTMKLMKKYKVGTSKYWDGATVFWQTDNQNRVRTGKIMLYNPETGKRVKEPYNHVTWVHSVLHKGDYNLRQCFFGEHLLSENKSRPVALVESEKTRFGKVMFQVIALLADAQEQFLGPRTGPLLLGARYLLCEDQLGPAHRIIGIEIAFVVEHEARNRINQQYARKEKGEVAVNGPAPFPHGGHKRPCPHDVQNFLFQNFITPAVHMVERKVFLAFFGFAVGDTGTEVGDTLFGAAGNRFAAGLMFGAASV